MRTRHVALLRGVNVGGKNKLPMKDLVLFFEQAGCERVRHYIQSGNVVFDADAALAKKIPGLISARILERFGFETKLVIRTAEELRRAANGNPFAGREAHDIYGAVMFLAEQPQAADIEKLDQQRSVPDEFDVKDGTIYLHAPNGLARTKLTNAYFDSRLKTVSTSRNWRTVFRLLEMLEE